MNDLLHKRCLRLLLLGAASLGIAGAHPAWAQASAASTAASAPATADAGPAVDGFRTAKFGMTESALRSAITKDFNLPASAITTAENSLQRTTVLSVTVPDLVPGGGAAEVSYVLGYQSHKLIEVNILWSAEIDPKITPTMLYQDGQSLQQYFAGEGFPPERTSGNIATPNGVLLFRATDTSGNAVLLILSGNITKDQKSDKTVLSPNTLTLAYAADPLHPDVFQLTKGSF